MIGLEDAIETISLAVVKCQFYQAIYDFSLPANSPVAAAQMYDQIWQILRANLPRLYAAVVKFAKKAKSYFAPERTVKKKGNVRHLRRRCSGVLLTRNSGYVCEKPVRSFLRRTPVSPGRDYGARKELERTRANQGDVADNAAADLYSLHYIFYLVVF